MTNQSVLFRLSACVALSTACGFASDPEVENRVNQYFASESAVERASLVRSLRKEEFAEVEAAVRAGATAKPQKETDAVIQRTLTTEYGRREFETLVYIPGNYTPQKRYKLLVALHGTGGHGSGYIQAWLPWLRKRHDIILAAPTITGEPWGGSRTAHSHVHTLIKQLSQEFAIDADRVYLDGMSMGGHAAFRIGCFRADRFAGLICRAHGPIFLPDAKGGGPRFLENLNNTPLYWIVGQTDPGIPIERMRRGQARLQELKYDVTYLEKPGGHEAYLDENDNILKWIEDNKRELYPKQIVFHTNRPDYQRMGWVEIAKFAGRPPATVRTLDFEGKTAGTRKEYLQNAVVNATCDRATNSIVASTKGVRQLGIYLSDEMLDLDAPVKIRVNGRLLWQKPLRRSLEILLEDSRLRGDRSMVYSARVVLNVP